MYSKTKKNTKPNFINTPKTDIQTKIEKCINILNIIQKPTKSTQQHTNTYALTQYKQTHIHRQIKR